MAVYISASLLNDYISCSMKANYRLFAKPSAEIAPNKYMIIGTIVHNAIEKYWNNREKAVEYPYIQVYLDKPTITKKDLSTMESHIHSYFDNFAKFMTDKDEIEKNFKVKLYDDVYLVGKLDRISNGVVYDWKTSAKVPSHLNDDPQFIIYHDAYKRVYGTYPNAIFLASLTEGRLVPYEHSEFHREILFNDIIPMLIKDIKNKNFVREGIFKKGTCYFCSYKEDCLKGLKEHGVVHSREFAEE